jgi:hypothetical protein
MENKPYKSVTVTGPKDRSLEGYKAWIRDLAKNLTIGTDVRWTDEEWIASWKTYWKEKPIE